MLSAFSAIMPNTNNTTSECRTSSHDTSDSSPCASTASPKSMAYGLCAAQVIVLLLEMVYRAEPAAVLYSTRITNVTSDPPVVHLSTQEYGLSPLFLIASIFVMLFAAVTHQLDEQQILDNAMEYADDAVATHTGMWNSVLWTTFVLVHAAVVIRLTSPVDTYLLLLLVATPLYCVSALCSPPSTAAHTGAGRSQQATFLISAYAVSMMGAFNNMPVQRGMDVVVFGLLLISDMLLVMGHIYDSNPNMQTVGHCRLTYAAGSALLLLGVYGI
jgi:hypothetical protein